MASVRSPGRSMGLVLTVGVLCCLIPKAIALTDSSSGNKNVFDLEFVDFLRENKYMGGAVAAMKDGKLLVAKGYGTDRAGNEVAAGSKFPVSSVAKSLTAVAVMQMVENGKLSLQTKVFGDNGILKEIEPWRREAVDPRLYEVTIDHLLHHSAGWDSKSGPLYDPLLNEMYHSRHQDVPNIAQDMSLTFPLKPTELISYIMSQPLNFSPGMSVAYSNMAYLVLGRVIEAASDMEYKDFIKRYILDPCGMWNTHLVVSKSKEDKHSTTHIKTMYGFVDPVNDDSALGWYSNVYDMMRFVRCTFETGQLLNEKYLSLLVDKPDHTSSHNNHSWYSAGFHADIKGNVWQDSDMHADDLILYHRLRTKNKVSHDEDLPDSWVVLLYGKGVKNFKHSVRDLMSPLDFTNQQENLFLYDLSDLHKHPKWERATSFNGPEYGVKYNIDEHHLTSYANAVRNEGLDIIWLTSYTVQHHTHFLLTIKHTAHPIRAQYDYIFEHGLDHRQLLKRKLQLEESGYNMTQLHSYKSQSHSSPVSFAAIFRHEAFSSDIQMKYGTGHLPEPYQKLVQMYYEKQFYPISQTVVYLTEDEHFSFIFIKGTEDEQTDFKHYYDLSPGQLAKLTEENAQDNLQLSYLNSYDVSGKFKLAAVYTNATDSKGLLEIDQSQNLATETMIDNLQRGLNPKFVVPYIGDDSQLKLATYYENV